MLKTIISCVVAVLCSVALCVTYAVTNNNSSSTGASSQLAESSDYMTEKEAAAYIGVTDEVMQMMREKLKLFDGAYESYTYTSGSDEITDIVYNKDRLNEKIKEIMKSENSALNFKYIQNADKK